MAESLDLWRELGNAHEVSVVAYDLANIEHQLGLPEEARGRLHTALEAVRSNARPMLHEARIRTLLGALYFYRGETTRAIREYREALQVLDRDPRPDDRWTQQRARTLTHLGNALPALPEAPAGVFEEARVHLDEAGRLRTELGENHGIAVTANSLGLLYERRNRPRAAFAEYQKAAEILSREGPAAHHAVVRGNQCRIVERLDQLDAARDCYLEALESLREAGLQNAEAITLGDLARNARRRDELQEARRWTREALEILELIRGESRSSEFRSSFLERKYDVYQLAVDLALELHEREPQGGYDHDAFRDLESARARVFLETLVRFRPELELPPRLLELRAEIHRHKVESLAAEGRPADVDRLESELDSLLERFHQEHPGYAFVEPKILSVAEVRGLLDDETTLLEYHLGEERSAVWAITDSGVVWRPLPPRSVIEQVAGELYRAMSSGTHKIRTWKYPGLSSELSRMILKPVADLLDRPHLVVVSAGALRYVPFAALPHPAGLAESAVAFEEEDSIDPEPLLLSHRITSAPSASVLGALRERRSGRSPANALLTLVGAPVLHRADKRFEGPVLPDPGNRRRLATDLITPLPHAEEEAETILELVEGEDVRSALGFDANREVVFSSALENVRIIHFATHGLLDDARGELSGLALSQFDAAGRSVDGFVWAYEIYQLDLKADLVVLSACDTALGEAFRGEGLVGLTQGFLYAGANNVMVSLWKVIDEATARLMGHFYRRLLRGGLPPAEALRQAQIDLRSEGWVEPYFWAPFVLQGDLAAKSFGPVKKLRRREAQKKYPGS